MKFVLGILVLSVVIFFHELGHFLLAKANHIVVNEFAFGMGPKLIAFTKGETTYAIKLLPFGGSCTMMGEDQDEEAAPGCFNHASVWARISVVAAGPLFNFLMAFLVSLIVVAAVGSDPATVVEVEEGSPAQEAGLQEGDLILKYQGNGIANARELYTDITLDDVPLDEIRMVVKRDGEKIPVTYAPTVTTRYMLGYYYSQEEPEQVTVTDLVKGYPMEAAGFLPGDVLTSIDDFKITTLDSLLQHWEEHPLDGTPVRLTADRNGETFSAEITPMVDTSASLGFSFNLMPEKLSPLGTIKAGFGEMSYWIHVTLKSLATLFRGQYGVKDLSGPVGVVSVMGDTYDEVKDEGTTAVIVTFLNFIILLSANLGVMNLLPIPALDGGRLVFLIIEAILGKPLNRRFENYVHIGGLMLLMVLMVFIMFNDIVKLL